MHELYGPEAADSLLTKFGKLFTTFLQDKGLTASASDLILKKDAERFRRKKVKTKMINNVIKGKKSGKDCKREGTRVFEKFWETGNRKAYDRKR